MLARAEVLDRMRRSIAEGRPIIGAGAGRGLSAKCAEQGGADVIIIYNSGRYRTAPSKMATRDFARSFARGKAGSYWLCESIIGRRWPLRMMRFSQV